MRNRNVHVIYAIFIGQLLQSSLYRNKQMNILAWLLGGYDHEYYNIISSCPYHHFNAQSKPSYIVNTGLDGYNSFIVLSAYIRVYQWNAYNPNGLKSVIYHITIGIVL